MTQNTNNLSTPFNQPYLDAYSGAAKFNYEPMTYDVYKNMAQHDPCTIYIVDRGDGVYDYYAGDIHICDTSREEKSHYDLSITKEGKYLISYLYFHDRVRVDPVLYSLYDEDWVSFTKVAEFNDAQDAINALHTYSKYGFHKKEQFKVRDIIYRMIHKEISLHEAIMGILTVYNYSEWPDFQRVNKIILEAPMARVGIDEVTMQKLRLSRNVLFVRYSLIYDEFMKNEFFTSKQYTDTEFDELDVSDSVIAIDRICKVVPDFGLLPNRVDDDISR